MFKRAIIPALLALALAACAAPQIKLRSDYSEPLQEFTLQGTGADKVLLLPIRGVISNDPSEGFLSSRPGLVQEVVSHLRHAEADPAIKAVILSIDSPGGGSVDSEILHHELSGFAARRKVKLVALMQGMAASGGYYAALAAERLVAHPSSITGSVGTIFLRPKVHGLMDKIGVGVEVSKSGRLKDMASPFRETTPEEKALIEDMIRGMNARFLDLAAQRRGLSPERLAEVATARIYSADQALAAGLIDSVGYLDEALAQARGLAGLGPDARLVVFRRSGYAEDNPYNPVTGSWDGGRPLLDLSLARLLPAFKPGFYHLWAPEYGAE